MTDQELQQLAREYANYVVKDFVDDLSKDIIRTARQSCEETAHEILRWLSARYCIVEKSKVKEAMKYPQRYTEPIRNTIHFQTLGIKKVLTDLFGKELFNEE